MDGAEEKFSNEAKEDNARSLWVKDWYIQVLSRFLSAEYTREKIQFGISKESRKYFK